MPASSVTSLHQLSALLNTGHMEALSRYEGRVCLVVNMATGDPTTRQELTQVVPSLYLSAVSSSCRSHKWKPPNSARRLLCTAGRTG